MDISVNFYELKEELASLGFRAPEVTDQLRKIIGREGFYESVHTKWALENSGTVEFSINLMRDANGRLSHFGYEGMLTVMGDPRSFCRFQNFEPDVPADLAIQLLNEKSKFPELDEISCNTPLSLKQADERFKSYSQPVPVEKMAAVALSQLKTIGFDDAATFDQLLKKIADRQVRFYLNVTDKSPEADFIYALTFLPGKGNSILLDHYQGYVKPHDPQVWTLIEQDPDHYPRGQKFESDVQRSTATQFLAAKLPLQRYGPQETQLPMTQQEVMALLNKKQSIMNAQNFEFLKKTLLNLGFGEKVNAELEKQISKKTPEFTLAARHEFNQQKVDYTLHFKAGETDGMYFFNKYDANITKGKGKDLEQTFYISKGNGITAKEAFNLMEGRAVHKQLFNKDGEKYQAWLQLDGENLTQNGSKEIKRFNENYGFDLEKVISGKGIKEMETTEGKENLMRSLRKGNQQQITVTRNGADTKYFITASPQYKTVDLFDHQMKKIKREELLTLEQKQGSGKKQGQQQKEGLPEKKQSSKRKMTV